MNKKDVLKRSFSLLFLSLITFILHSFCLKQIEVSLLENKLILAYVFNTLYAIFSIHLLYFFKKKYRDQLGFFFMGLSLFKFAFFFILFHPTYKADNNISTIEFTSFFTPYIICLISEVYVVSKLLNHLK